MKKGRNQESSSAFAKKIQRGVWKWGELEKKEESVRAVGKRGGKDQKTAVRQARKHWKFFRWSSTRYHLFFF